MKMHLAVSLCCCWFLGFFLSFFGGTRFHKFPKKQKEPQNVKLNIVPFHFLQLLHCLLLGHYFVSL